MKRPAKSKSARLDHGMERGEFKMSRSLSMVDRPIKKPPPPKDPLLVVVETTAPEHDLASNVKRFLLERYSSQIMDAEQQQQSALTSALSATSVLLDHVCSCKGIGAVAQDVVIQEFHALVFPCLAGVTRIDEATPKDIAQLLQWYHRCGTKLIAVFPDTTIPTEALCRMEELKTEYLQRGVHDRMRSMICNRWKLSDEYEVRQDDQGYMVTTRAEDLAYMVQVQLDVAREALPDDVLPDVAASCNQELMEMVGNIMVQIGSEWKSMTIERICSVVNDAQRLLEFCEETNHSMALRWEEDVKAEGEDLLRSLTELSLHATEYLCQRIMQDVREEHLGKVGGLEWETTTTTPSSSSLSSSSLVVGTTLATLADYYDDLQEWVPAEYYFPKILKHTFDLTLQHYLESFFANTMLGGVHDLDKCVATMREDWMALWRLFAGKDLVGFAGRAGHYSKEVLWRRLYILQALSSVLSPELQPTDLLEDLRTILTDLGQDTGSAAILHLVGIRYHRMNRRTAHEWHTMIARATQHVEMQQGGGGNNSGTKNNWCRLPDLRNSPYIRRVLPDDLGGGRRRGRRGRFLHHHHHHCLDDDDNDAQAVDTSSTSRLVGSSRRHLVRSVSRRLEQSFRKGGGIGGGKSSSGLLSNWRLEEEEATTTPLFNNKTRKPTLIGVDPTLTQPSSKRLLPGFLNLPQSQPSSKRLMPGFLFQSLKAELQQQQQQQEQH